MEHLRESNREAYEAVSEILKCKWTLLILDAITRGVNRPGRLERELPGLTTKVLNERIKKLERFGVISKLNFPEVPPRVEYQLTERGKQFLTLIMEIRAFAENWK